MDIRGPAKINEGAAGEDHSAVHKSNRAVPGKMPAEMNGVPHRRSGSIWKVLHENARLHFTLKGGSRYSPISSNGIESKPGRSKRKFFGFPSNSLSGSRTLSLFSRFPGARLSSSPQRHPTLCRTMFRLA